MNRIKCREKLNIMKEYFYDCIDYMGYNYNHPKLKTKGSMEAKILRQAHILEKGMSLSNPKEKFGVEKAMQLMEYIEDFDKYGYSINESEAVKNSLYVVGAYIEFHKKRGFSPENVIDKYNKYTQKIHTGYGNNTITYLDLRKQIDGNFEEFFNSRHSLRQFSDREIDEIDIKKAVSLAMKAPSACNRQSSKVYYYKNRDIIKKLAEIIPGNTGFESEAANYLVITSDMSAFHNEFERNQVYVDGGIFALALAEALHYYGIANCILQNGEFHKRNKKLREILGNIPQNEKIILFIAIGYYKDEVCYASSHRKCLKDVLKIAE